MDAGGRIGLRLFNSHSRAHRDRGLSQLVDDRLNVVNFH